MFKFNLIKRFFVLRNDTNNKVNEYITKTYNKCRNNTHV